MASKTDDAAAAGKGAKLRTIALAAGFAVIGALAGPKLLGSGDGAVAGATEGTTTTTAAGPMVVLDAVTLNLTDGHLLQVGLALELSPEADRGGHAGDVAEDDPTKGYARALDAAISVFGEQSMTTLAAPGGREAAKAALEQALHDMYHGDITGVYLHQFVMQ